MDIKVSVIIPVFNTEEYLDQCLKSVSNQTLKDIEIICVYTDSKDKSLEIINNWQKIDNRIKIIKRNDGGLGGARNEGLKYAKGEYIAFLDSDDWVDVEAYEKLLATAEKTRSDMVLFPFYSYNNKTQKIEKDAWGTNLNIDKELINKVFNYKDISIKNLISEYSPVTAWSKLYNAKFLKDNNLKFPENLRYEDNPFYYECLIKDKRISVLNERILFYRINRENSLQASKFNNKNVLDIIPVLKQISNTLIVNNVDSKILEVFNKYAINELVWRYNKMSLYREALVKLTKENFERSFYENFLHTINYNPPENIVKKSYESVKNPKITVILPVYNVEKYIEDCILSIINQTLTDIEVIFVDDCGSDNSISIVEEYAKFDKRIKVVKNEKNSGAAQSRNNGLSHATGEFVCFMDPDDAYASDDILEIMYNTVIQNDVLAVCGNIKVVEDSYRYYNFSKKTSSYYGFNVLKDGLYTYEDYNIWSSWGFTRFIFNRKYIMDNKILFPNYRHYEDPLFFVTLMSSLNKFYGINKDVYLYRQVQKDRKMSYLAIKDTLLSIKEVLNIYLENKFFSHYVNEYQTLINFIKNDFSYYIFEKKDNYKDLIQLINEDLNEIDFDIVTRFSSYNIYRSFSDVLKKEKIKKDSTNIFKRAVKKALKPVYLPIKNRFVDIIDSRTWELKEEINNKYNELLNVTKESRSKFSDIENKTNLIYSEITNYKNEKKDNKNILKDIEFLVENTFNNMFFDKKIFLIGSSEHSNIGDAAISRGTYEFIFKYFKEYKLIEISTFELDEKMPYIEKVMNNNDLIFLQGGGNLGSKWLAEENLRRKIIEYFPQNKIIIFPQTIYFEPGEKGDKELEISKRIYNQHSNLLLFTRGKISLEFAKKHFPNVPSYCTLDTALNINIKFNFVRNGILCCLRDLTDESGITKSQYDEIISTIKRYDNNFAFTNNLYEGEIDKIHRNFVVNEQLKKFASHQLIITDRLHGLIFSLMTNTPCIVFSSYNYKLKEFTDMLKDNPFISFIDKDVSKLDSEIKRMLKLDCINYQNNFDKEFDKISKIIKRNL